MSLAGTAFIDVRGDFSQFDRQGAAATAAFQKRMDSTWATAGQKLARSGQNMSRLGQQMTRTVTVPLLAVGAASIKAASDFEGAMTQVRTQAGASAGEIEKMRGSILKLSPAVGKTPVELANALFHIESSGIRGAKALDLLRNSAKLSQIGHADLEATTNALVATMKSAPKDVKSASDAIGLLNAIVGQGNMRMEDLTAAMSTGILPAAKSVGLGLRDVGAAIDVMTARGVPAQDAATRLRMTFSLLSAPTAQAAKALKTVGLGSSDLAKDLRKPDGLVVAVRDLKDHMDKAGLSAVQQNQLIAKAFGGGRSSSAILTLLQNVDDLQARFEGIGKQSGAAEVNKAWKTTTHDLGFQFDQLKSDAVAAGAKIGEAIGPEVISFAKDVAHDASSIADAFSKLPKGAQETIVKGGLILAGIGPALRLAGVFTTGVGRLYNAALLVGRIMKGTEFGALSGKGAATAAAGRATTAVATMEVGTLVAKSMVGGGTVPLGGSTATATRAGTAAESAVVGASAATIAKGLLTRLIRGGTIAGIGAIGAQVVGGAIGGKAGSTIGHIGSGAAIGAGIGTAIEPGIGTAVGAALGGAFALFTSHHAKTAGEKLGNQVAAGMKKTAGGAIPEFTRAVAKATDDANKKAPHPSAAARTFAPSQFGGVRVMPAQAKATAAQLAAQQQAFFKGGLNAGKAWADGMSKQGAHLNLGILVKNAQAGLSKMPPAMRAGAAQSMEAFVKEMQAKGRLPKGSLDAFIKSMNAKFPSLVKGFDYAGAASSRALAAQLKFGGAQKSVQSFLGFLKGPNGWQGIPKTADINTQNAAAVFKTNLDFLHHTAKTSTGKTKDDALANWKTLRDRGVTYFSDMRAGIDAQMKAQVKSLGKNTDAGRGAIQSGYKRIVAVIQQEMNAGVISTHRGLELINKTFNKEAKALNLKPIQGAILSVQQSTENALGFAGGGFVDRPGLRGRDDTPLMVPPGTQVFNYEQQRALGMFATGGQVPIVVGRGEYVAPPEEAPYWNQRASGHGGLRGLFAKFTRPHYAAKGGLIQRFAKGGIAQMLAEAGAIDSHHYPYRWGGGHNDRFSGPYDCSGAVSAVLHAAGLLAHPMVASQFKSYGQPGAGAVTIYASDGHVYMSIGGKFFGTSGSNPGGGAGFFPGGPRAGFTVRHAPASGGTVPTPKVRGAQPLKGMVQSLLTTSARGANRKLSAAIAALGQTGGGDPGDSGGGTVTASVFSGTRGAGGSLINQNPEPFAELSDPPSSLNFSALGKWPMGTRARITYKGHSLVGQKKDVGKGGPGLRGHKRAIDLHDDLARALHFSGLDLVNVQRLAGGGIAGSPPPPPGPAPDQVSAARLFPNVRGAKDLIRRVWGAMPTGRFRYPPIGFINRKYPGVPYTTHDRSVHYPYWVIPTMLAKKSDRLTDWIHSGIVHEFAHVMQKPGAWNDERLAEGGAEYYANLVAPGVYGRLGIPYHPSPDSNYAGYVSWVAKNKGPQWALHGQFRNRGGIVGAPQRFAGGGIVRGAQHAATGLIAAAVPHHAGGDTHHRHRTGHHRLTTLQQLMRSFDIDVPDLAKTTDPIDALLQTAENQYSLLGGIATADKSLTNADSSLGRLDAQDAILGRFEGMTDDSGNPNHLKLTAEDLGLVGASGPPFFAAGTGVFDAEITNRNWKLQGLRDKIALMLRGGALSGADIGLLAPTFVGKLRFGEGDSITEAQLRNRGGRSFELQIKRAAIIKALSQVAMAKTERDTRRNLILKYARHQVKRLGNLKKDLADLQSSSAARRLAAANDAQRRGERRSDAQETIRTLQEQYQHEQARGPAADKGRMRDLKVQIGDEQNYVRSLDRANSTAVQSAREAQLRQAIQRQEGPIQDALEQLTGNRSKLGSGGFLGKIAEDLSKLGTMKTEFETTAAQIAQVDLPTTTLDIGSINAAQADLATQADQIKQVDIPNLLLDIQDIRDRGAKATSAPKSDVDQQKADMLQQLLDQAHLALSVSQTQYDVLKVAPPFGGSFAEGGVVPGPVGAPRMIVAHGGETVTAAGDGGSITDVHVYFANGMEWLRDFIRIEVDRRGRDQARAAGYALPGRGGGGLR